MILVLPGMGADHRMYAGPWRSSVDYDFLDWPTKRIPVSLRDLAELVAETIDYQPEAIIGSSLGGMVALELAEIVGAPEVVLVGSATSGQELNPLIRRLGPLADFTPLHLVKVLAGKAPWLLSRMYAEQAPDFIRAMIRAVLEWSYAGEADVFRIHGRRDHVIQCQHADVWIDGGHLIAMTHAVECVAAIRRARSGSTGDRARVPGASP